MSPGENDGFRQIPDFFAPYSWCDNINYSEKYETFMWLHSCRKLKFQSDIFSPSPKSGWDGVRRVIKTIRSERNGQNVSWIRIAWIIEQSQLRIRWKSLVTLVAPSTRASRFLVMLDWLEEEKEGVRERSWKDGNIWDYAEYKLSWMRITGKMRSIKRMFFNCGKRDCYKLYL